MTKLEFLNKCIPLIEQCHSKNIKFEFALDGDKHSYMEVVIERMGHHVYITDFNDNGECDRFTQIENLLLLTDS